MLDLIKNGDFINQIFHPWHSNDYPEKPVMPHYQGSSFSVPAFFKVVVASTV